MTVRVPIYIANPRPFRLVLRGKDDIWEPTIEQINSSTYNYVKLHRATKFFDAEVAVPFPLCVAFDGSFILPAVRQYGSIEATLDEFNRVFASMLIGGVYTESVDPEDLSQGEMTEVGYFRHIRTLGGNGELHKALGNKDGRSGESIRLIGAPTIMASEIESAYIKGAQILKAIENLSPSLLITSFTYFIKRQTKEALSHAWICTEQLLDHIWRLVVINEAGQSQVPKRRKFLESQQWSAAHKIELLYQKSIVTAEAYEKLGCARDARNQFIHRGVAPSQESTRTALEALIDLLSCASRRVGVNFDESNLLHYVVPHRSPASDTVAGKAGDFDWSQVKYWKKLPPIPGEDRWEGDFEQFEDITLQPIKQNAMSDG